jgi:hypothetical protein
MQAIATICSRHKKQDLAMLPARARYTGEHINKVAKIADESGISFYILSGKYGLISADKEIADYDYYLEQKQVNPLATTISGQLTEAGITELDFYTEDKESWAPYIEAMQKGAALAKVSLNVHAL